VGRSWPPLPRSLWIGSDTAQGLCPALRRLTGLYGLPPIRIHGIPSLGKDRVLHLPERYPSTMRKRDVVFYDGACGWCRGSSRVLLALDWLDALEARDLTRVPEDQLPTDLTTALEGMPMRTAKGNVLIGYPALRRALLLTPLGFPVALAMWIPGLSAAGRAFYRWFAANRPRDAACELPNRI
jgi:predicted DCC family thiol-disulfide oxidoreductase YuxK